MPRIQEADDLDGGAAYPIITGDYAGAPAWGHHPIEVGTPVAKPSPDLHQAQHRAVDEELARLVEIREAPPEPEPER